MNWISWLSRSVAFRLLVVFVCLGLLRTGSDWPRYSFSGGRLSCLLEPIEEPTAALTFQLAVRWTEPCAAHTGEGQFPELGCWVTRSATSPPEGRRHDTLETWRWHARFGCYGDHRCRPRCCVRSGSMTKQQIRLEATLRAQKPLSTYQPASLPFLLILIVECHSSIRELNSSFWIFFLQLNIFWKKKSLKLQKKKY